MVTPLKNCPYNEMYGGAIIKLSSLAHDLYDEIAELDVIDAHEHLPPENEYLSKEYSGPNMFAGGYIWRDLESAGLDTPFASKLREGGLRPVETWWPEIKPYWEQVKYTSFARALMISVRDLYNIDTIEDATIHRLAEHVVADNAPGLYGRILYDRCRIRKVITCIEHLNFEDDPNFCGLSISLGETLRTALKGEFVAKISERVGIDIRSLEDLVEVIQKAMREDISRGAVGFKIVVDDHGESNPTIAGVEFQEALHSAQPIDQFPGLRDHVFDKGLDVAAEAGIPVAVHAGYLGDFRDYDPKLMLGFAPRRPDVHFDLFHLGTPMIRDAILIGKNLKNVSLNLTWNAIISQVQTTRAMDEIIDLVPMSKIIAFGADYKVSVQKVWGHLVMARECVADALARRIESNLINRKEAIKIAQSWFFDNPRDIYKLSVK
jgi:predicted TIM-barrel fold metal-dependent hydrolase